MDNELLKEKLLEEKALLEKELTDVSAPVITKDSSDFRDDMANDFEELDEHEATKAALRVQLDEVISALARMDDGTYGLCRVCKQPIEEDRLEALPSAATCMTHMEHDLDALI